MMRVVALLLSLLMLSPTVWAESEWDSTPTVVVSPIDITVYRSETCQCCHKWIKHLEHHGFRVVDQISNNVQSIKNEVNLPSPMRSCHTAMVGNYLIEGHVPAQDIHQLLKTKPAIRGLSVPAMPVGTPGMEMGERKDSFDVIGFDGAGKFSLFNRYETDDTHRYQSVIVEE